MVIIIGIQKLSKGFLGNIAILIGIIAGTIIAIPMGMVDFSNISHAEIFNLNTPYILECQNLYYSSAITIFSTTGNYDRCNRKSIES